MYKPAKMAGMPSVVLCIHFKVLDCKIRDALFFVFAFYVCIIYVKSIINLLQFSTI